MPSPLSVHKWDRDSLKPPASRRQRARWKAMAYFSDGAIFASVRYSLNLTGSALARGRRLDANVLDSGFLCRRRLRNARARASLYEFRRNVR